MTKRNSKRLFERQALNFKYVKASFPNLKVDPDVLGMAPCPLCLSVFMVETDGSDVVSREHAPPSQLGGKVIGLTCTNCNHT
ncbi:MAG: hypothetical protein K8F91_19435, partial [Candidatus Obscuribacterales bacterium]|nr:hypothetical protein [Candidatus Obscuribacterales bacterium]